MQVTNQKKCCILLDFEFRDFNLPQIPQKLEPQE